ncbi:MAG: phosphatase PAP2 family protein [Oscillospiraceae bacterium]|jgi:undecaprenyl-diphosphatase|nr:phosphatase PAP2 family protein [Oscillospiraceae bacterium]
MSFSIRARAAAIASAIIFAVLAALTALGKLDAVNASIINLVQEAANPRLTSALTFITNIGEWYVYIPLALLLFAIPKTRWKVGLPIMITLALSASLNSLIKVFFAVPRPNTNQLVAVSGFSFPSGHAMNGAAFVVACASLFIRHYARKRAARLTAAVCAAAFLLVIGFSRVYLGVHSPADVMAGWALGVFVCVTTLTVAESRMKNKRRIDGLGL